MKVAIVIPSRYGSSRFPGKPLIRIGEKPLIQHVWEGAMKCRRAGRVVVATDDDRIARAVESFGGEAMITTGNMRTGTDRLAALSEQLSSDAYVNLQGDELILDGEILDDLIERFMETQPCEMGSLKRKITEEAEWTDPNVVKVVTDSAGSALYFSRAPIPHLRDRKGNAPSDQPGRYKHIGIYIYQSETLKRLGSLPTGRLEEAEKLEQLRALEYGIPIRVWDTPHDSLRVDTPADARRAEEAMASVSMNRKQG